MSGCLDKTVNSFHGELHTVSLLLLLVKLPGWRTEENTDVGISCMSAAISSPDYIYT